MSPLDNYKFHFTDQSFQHPSTANDSGLVSVSFILTLEDLICAYRFGIFPVNDPADPIAWWSPNPRWVLDPMKVKVSKSMRKVIRDQPWKMTVDTCFADVMRLCAQSRNRKSGLDTWITEEIIVEYTKLFEMGRAHSFEVWNGTELVGGFYGVLTGKIFSGESMFAHESNASKYAFIIGCQFFEHLGIELVDCQMHSEHLESLGAYPVDRDFYLDLIKRKGFENKGLNGSWTEIFDDFLGQG